VTNEKASPPEQPAFVFENRGYCPCCRATTIFRAYQDWLRDFYVCTQCGSIPRQRHIQAVLDGRFPGWEKLVVHESSPSNDFISRYAADYSSSQYFSDVTRGELSSDGVRSEDVENLTFADSSIDIFITQDVLEHVFHPERAICEIHRVLKPGGAHVFTAPKHKGLLDTRQRARMRPDGTVEHILAEEYHGNPIGDNKALVTYDYGYDFEQLMSTWSGVSVEAIHTVDRTRGLDAEFNEVYVIVKPGARPERFASGGRPIAAGKLASALGRHVLRRARRIAGRVKARVASRP